MPHSMRFRHILKRFSANVMGTNESRSSRIWRALGQDKSMRWANQQSRTKRSIAPAALASTCGIIGAGTIIAASIVYWGPVAHAEAPPAEEKKFIRLDEVKQHGKSADRKWVIKGTRVFDITDWIAAHPGGPVIIRAVGGSIDPYWDIFSIHQNPDVYDILEDYFIGDIDPRDLVNGAVGSDNIEDPFVNDPPRDSSLIQHTEKPCNAETPTSLLDTFITPNEVFYVRNHLWVPEVEGTTHTLTVELPDGNEKEYTLAELKSKFAPFHITATLQCSGNRRKHMSAGARHAAGLQWDIGAISNAKWTGVRLRDVLRDAGVDVDARYLEDAKHVQFVGAEAYGASIPIDKALQARGDVMLAYEMNGRALPRDHGYPLRVLVPGHTAARSVKWLEKIILSEEESQSQWQQRDYKCFGPNQTGKDLDWSSAPAIQETPVQSAMTSIKEVSPGSFDASRELQKPGLTEDAVQVAGYALSGGGREIIRVDISADGGSTWQQAVLLPDEAEGQQSWSWKRWHAIVSRPVVGSEMVVKAIDDGYNTQPESYVGQYNFRGNLTTAWHRVRYPFSEDRPTDQS